MNMIIKNKFDFDSEDILEAIEDGEDNGFLEEAMQSEAVRFITNNTGKLKRVPPPKPPVDPRPRTPPKPLEIIPYEFEESGLIKIYQKDQYLGYNNQSSYEFIGLIND